MKRTVIESAPVPSHNGRQCARYPLWPRIVRALASPAAWWSCFAMLMLFGVLHLAICLLPLASLHNSASPTTKLIGWGYQPGMTCNWYLRHGQWRADLRTSMEIVRYVFSTDLDYSASPLQPNTMPYLSATTNWGTNMPRV
jgi:hypothetical protein